MMKAMRSSLCIALVLVLALTTACTDQGNKSSENQVQTQNAADTVQDPSPQLGNGSTTATGAGDVRMLGTTADGNLPVRRSGTEDYVQATKLMEVIGYKCVWDSNMKVLKFGDNDAAFEVTMDSTQARREEETLRLKSAPILIDGIPYLPVAILGDLLSDEVVFSKQGDMLTFQPAPEPIPLDTEADGELPQGDSLNFGEDPADPYKDLKVEEAAALPDGIDEEGAITAAALRNINIPSLISRARSYLGVRYDFGAAPYSQSGRFDCSSYTQYLFGKYGITLPRTARAQSRLGNPVSRSNLRRGDLLFFYVPGRFKTNKTVGHVGIYVGNFKMIHASPLPKDGVQITDINKPYWKRTYLFSKRLAY